MTLYSSILGAVVFYFLGLEPRGIQNPSCRRLQAFRRGFITSIYVHYFININPRNGQGDRYSPMPEYAHVQLTK